MTKPSMTRRDALAEQIVDFEVDKRAAPLLDEAWRFLELASNYCVSDCEPDPFCGCSEDLRLASSIFYDLAEDENLPPRHRRLMPRVVRL